LKVKIKASILSLLTINSAMEYIYHQPSQKDNIAPEKPIISHSNDVHLEACIPKIE
jgi:hypothetical protein